VACAISNCTLCETTNTCSSCITGTTLYSNICVTCSVTNCLLCNSTKLCQTCLTGSILCGCRSNMQLVNTSCSCKAGYNQSDPNQDCF
jgi:hypothetical protein